MTCSFRSTRHGEPRALAGTLVAVVVLGGCSSLSLPERFEIPPNGEDFRTRVYAGATMGNSHLTPDTRGTVFNVEDTEDLGTQITLGVDVHNALAVELDTSILGTATLREANTDVNYSAASISALVYGLNGVQLRSRREGWSAFGRLGLGILKKSSAVLALDEGGTVPILGAGAEYGFPNGLGVRGEISRFDEDAVYLGLGAVYRFGLTPREVGGLIAEVAEPALSSTDTRVAAGGRVLDRPGRGARSADEARSGAASATPVALRRASRWRPRARADDRDRDGVRDARDRCPDTIADVTVDRVGCGLFDAVLEDVVFKSGSTWLTARARDELNRFAETLLAFPEAKVRVLAHTDSSGPADENLALSARRAESVVQYLETRGISELQLEARGLGETRPLASNRDPEGRRLNRRIEIETLVNLDAPVAMRPPGTDDRNEPVRWRPPESVRPGTGRAARPDDGACRDRAGDGGRERGGRRPRRVDPRGRRDARRDRDAGCRVRRGGRRENRPGTRRGRAERGRGAAHPPGGLPRGRADGDRAPGAVAGAGLRRRSRDRRRDRERPLRRRLRRAPAGGVGRARAHRRRAREVPRRPRRDHGPHGRSGRRGGQRDAVRGAGGERARTARRARRRPPRGSRRKATARASRSRRTSRPRIAPGTAAWSSASCAENGVPLPDTRSGIKRDPRVRVTLQRPLNLLS